MSSVNEAHALLDAATTARLTGVNLSKGNVDDSEFSNGSEPYITQRVVWSASKQLGLGDTSAGRHWGYLIFIIYVPKGSGDGDRNTLLNKVLKSFRSQAIGDVTTQQCRIVNQGATDQWSLTGVQVPFYTIEF